MHLPILGTTPSRFPITISPRSEDASQAFAEPSANVIAPSSSQQKVYTASSVTAETQASLLALQEDASPAPSKKTVDVNGLSVIVSGHSVDEREGVSLLRTISPSEVESMMADIAAMDDDAEAGAEEGAQQAAQSGHKIIRLDLQGYVMEVQSEALGPLPDGATSAYMNEDFSYHRGRWANGNPLQKSNSDAAIAEDNRVRLEALMNTVDAERKLRAEYGQDVKLVYSHTDNSYIMLTPDDAKYDTMKSAESAVRDVIKEVERGFVDRKMAADILGRHGYHI